MNRRSFIKGTFGGVVAGGVIVAATDADIAAFASTTPRDMPVDVNPQPDEAGAGVRYGEVLYNCNGQPVGIVRNIHFHQSHIDATPLGANRTTVVAGLASLTYDVVATGYTKV